MKGDILADTDNVARLCGGSHIDPDTGAPGPGAFMPREGEVYLSVNWLEYFDQLNHEERLREIKQALASKRTVGRMALLALLNVGGTTRHVGQDPLLAFTHEPIDDPEFPPDPSHSGINNFQGFEILVAEKLSQAVYEQYPARTDD